MLVEPFLVATLIETTRFNKALTKAEFLQLANACIKGTPTEQKVVKWKKHCKLYEEGQPLLGAMYYTGFMRRHGAEIERRMSELPLPQHQGQEAAPPPQHHFMPSEPPPLESMQGYNGQTPGRKKHRPLSSRGLHQLPAFDRRRMI